MWQDLRLNQGQSSCRCAQYISNSSIHGVFFKELAYYRTGLANLVKKSKYKAAMNARVVLQPGLEDLQLPRDENLAFEVVFTIIFFHMKKLPTINTTQVTGLPKLALLPDMSYLAPDCFHPSQKLHAKSKQQILFFCQNLQSMGNQSHPPLYSLVSLAVWNNMFEDNRAKSSWGQGSAGIRCNIALFIFVLVIMIPFGHCTLQCDFQTSFFCNPF